MYLIFVTFSVFRYSRPVIVFSFVRFAKNLYNDVGVYVLKLLSKTMCTIVPFPKFLLIVATVILSFTTTLFLGRVSPTFFLKVKVWVEDSYVAIYLELEAAFCATMPAGRSNNMSNINGNRANLQNFAPPIVHTAGCFFISTGSDGEQMPAITEYAIVCPVGSRSEEHTSELQSLS